MWDAADLEGTIWDNRVIDHTDSPPIFWNHETVRERDGTEVSRTFSPPFIPAAPPFMAVEKGFGLNRQGIALATVRIPLSAIFLNYRLGQRRLERASGSLAAASPRPQCESLSLRHLRPAGEAVLRAGRHG